MVRLIRESSPSAVISVLASMMTTSAIIWHTFDLPTIFLSSHAHTLPRQQQQQPPQPSIDQQVSSAIETYRNRNSLADLSDDRRLAKPLVNPHNDCYVNSFLQLFFHIAAIRTLFLNKTFMNHLNDQVMSNGTPQQIKESGAVVALALGHQFRQMFDGKDGLSGTYFKDSLRTITDRYNNNHQQDVNELLNQVLDILHNALKTNGGHDSPISELFGLRKCGICECECRI